MVYERFKIDPTSPVSVSQINEAIRCLWRWHLRYRMGIRSTERPSYMQVGTMVHRGVEALFNGKPEFEFVQTVIDERDKEVARLEALEDLALEDFNEAKDELWNSALLALELASRAYRWFIDNKWAPVTHNGALLVERRTEVEISGVPMVIIPDFVLKRDDGLVIVWDLKVRQSTGSFATQETEDTDLQTILYQIGLMQEGVETHGTGILSVLARAEAPVKVNKDGTPSRSISEQWCTGTAYRKALEERGLSASSAYDDILIKLDGRRWVEPVITPRTHEAFEQIWKKVVLPRLDDLGGPYHRNFGSFECPRCWAREYCLADLRGEDVIVVDVNQRVDEEEEAIGTTDETT